MANIQTFDYGTNLTQSILWQYNQATNLLSLINQKQAWYNIYQSDFWSSWSANIFNLYTTSTGPLAIFGAAIWSIILNVPFFVPLNETNPADREIWGFNETLDPFPNLLNTYLNYNNGNFLPENILSLEQQQFLLRLKYFQLSTLTNISAYNLTGFTSSTQIDYPSLYSINYFLNYLCANNNIGYTGTIYAIDNLNMTLTYNFTTDDFPLSLFNVMQPSLLDVFPRPAGVEVLFTGINGS
jgi:hypothetical protein